LVRHLRISSARGCRDCSCVRDAACGSAAIWHPNHPRRRASQRASLKTYYRLVGPNLTRLSELFSFFL
jgi:hypothetical protein